MASNSAKAVSVRLLVICTGLMAVALGYFLWVQNQDVEPEKMNSTAKGNPPVAGAVDAAGR